MEHDIISIVHCACCKYAEPFPTDPRVLICANPKWVPTGDGRGVKEPYVKPDDYCSFGEEKDNEMDDKKSRNPHFGGRAEGTAQGAYILGRGGLS